MVNGLYEQALMYLHRMPRIWLDYATFLANQHAITRTRRTFDRALKALPLSQHDKIWKVYVKWVENS